MDDRAARKRTREVLITLENVLPVPFKVKLVWADLEGFGETLFKDRGGVRYATITLKRGMPEALCVETLVHEWAHLLAADYYGTSHDAVWGLAYSDAYRVVYGEH